MHGVLLPCGGICGKLFFMTKLQMATLLARPSGSGSTSGFGVIAQPVESVALRDEVISGS